VGPKQVQVAEAQNVLKIAKQRLAEKQRGVQMVRIFFNLLNSQYFYVLYKNIKKESLPQG
jgi:dynein heavy chain